MLTREIATHLATAAVAFALGRCARRGLPRPRCARPAGA